MNSERIRKGEVVLDLAGGEYVTFVKWSLDMPGKAFVYNPRCAEQYATKIRRLNKKERGQ